MQIAHLKNVIEVIFMIAELLVAIKLFINRRENIKLRALEKKYRDKEASLYECLYIARDEIRDIKEQANTQVEYLRELTEEGEYDDLGLQIDELAHKIKEEKVNLETGNPFINAIIVDKHRRATKKHIGMNVNMSMPERLNVNVIDLCLMLSAPLDYIIGEYYNRAELLLGRVNLEGIWLKGYFILSHKFMINTEIAPINEETVRESLKDVERCLRKYGSKLEVIMSEKDCEIRMLLNTMENRM